MSSRVADVTSTSRCRRASRALPLSRARRGAAFGTCQRRAQSIESAAGMERRHRSTVRTTSAEHSRADTGQTPKARDRCIEEVQVENKGGHGGQPSLRGKNLQWRSVVTSLTSCCLLFSSMQVLEPGWERRVAARRHEGGSRREAAPQHVPWPAGWPGAPGAGKFVRHGADAHASCPICRYKPAARPKTATQRFLYPHSTRHGPS